jgi:hypothetical protein
VTLKIPRSYLFCAGWAVLCAVLVLYFERHQVHLSFMALSITIKKNKTLSFQQIRIQFLYAGMSTNECIYQAWVRLKFSLSLLLSIERSREK